MDPQQVAEAATALLIPLFHTALNGGVERMGELALEKLGSINRLLRTRFEADDDVYARQTLDRLEENPTSQGRQAALVSVIAEKAELDIEFLTQLTAAVKDVRGTQDVTSSIINVYGGEIGTVIGSIHAKSVRID